MKEFKELEIILSSYECDKHCPYCTAKITKWPQVKDDFDMLALNVHAMHEMGYEFHYVTLGGNGEPTLYPFEKLVEFIQIFDTWDIPVKRVLTSGNIFRPQNDTIRRLFQLHGWVFECTTTGREFYNDRIVQGYDFDYFETDAFRNSRVRLNYVLLKNNVKYFIDDIKSLAKRYPNIETIAVKLLNVNTRTDAVDNERSEWILNNAVPKSDRENIRKMLDNAFGESTEQFDTLTWKADGYDVYFSWKTQSYGFSDLVWYGDKFVNYDLSPHEVELMPRVYIASKFQKDANENFYADFRCKLISRNGTDALFRDFNTYSFIRSNGKPILQYIGPFWNEKAADNILTSDDCEKVVLTENSLIDMCDVFVCYFDDEVSPGSITELVYATLIGKKILIFYKVTDTRYKLKSASWYPIQFALSMGNALAVPVEGADEVAEHLLKGVANDYKFYSNVEE